MSVIHTLGPLGPYPIRSYKHPCKSLQFHVSSPVVSFDTILLMKNNGDFDGIVCCLKEKRIKTIKELGAPCILKISFFLLDFWKLHWVLFLHSKF